ncbi:hypothetical protein OsI_02811 [Oryza sativa Indica Group]|uniref:Uncharacterized protein n=1 Tax=Oryza sativa subsp. indica TaxID=39946 RepID=A2WSH1_ORYSI|nr:hypothetical protein OsI_02811 [Oryza sativa Indica Group]
MAVAVLANVVKTSIDPDSRIPPWRIKKAMSSRPSTPSTTSSTCSSASFPTSSTPQPQHHPCHRARQFARRRGLGRQGEPPGPLHPGAPGRKRSVSPRRGYSSPCQCTWGTPSPRGSARCRAPAPAKEADERGGGPLCYGRFAVVGGGMSAVSCSTVRGVWGSAACGVFASGP